MKLIALALLPALSFTVMAVDQASTPIRHANQAATTPTYPIETEVRTTLDRTVLPTPLPHGAPVLLPRQVSEYSANGYGKWSYGAPYPFILTDMITGDTSRSVPDPSAKTLLSFFTISDVHITDKETTAQAIYMCYENGPLANSSGYSAVMPYTTHVLDAAVQTINALHRKAPFDFGIALGDAANNNQYNELRWYLDVLDGKKITPSSGAHKGAKDIQYQKPYQAAGLDKSILWYQAIGNHDQYWLGSALSNDYIKKTLVGSRVLNIGMIPPSQPGGLDSRGFYMGVIDGTTPYGEVINAGPEDYFNPPPRVAADQKRHALTIRDWMNEFLKTTSNPVGHGFTKQNIKDGFACYSFRPKTGLPLKIIVFDDTDKAGSAAIALDYKRYDWLVSELDAGEAVGELMIVCAHIPISPYTNKPQPPGTTPWPLMPMFASYSTISESMLLAKLHTYKNLVMWVSGHVHRNTITPQPPPAGASLENGFWLVETPSLRDMPQQIRRFEIVRNKDNNISIFTHDIDTAVNLAPLPDGAASPALTSRSYGIATQEIFGNPVDQGPNVDPRTGVYNAELVKQLTPAMQAKLSQISK